MVIDRPDSRWHVMRTLWGQFPYYVPSIMLVLFGHTLWLPGDTFAATVQFDSMARIAGETHWAWLLMTVGGAHLIATFTGVRLLSLAALAAVLFCHALIAYLIWDASPVPTTGMRAYLLYVVIGIWSFSHWDVKWRRT